MGVPNRVLVYTPSTVCQTTKQRLTTSGRRRVPARRTIAQINREHTRVTQSQRGRVPRVEAGN